MKKWFVLSVLLLLSACEQPDFRDTEGRGYRLDDLRGRWLLVNYWATWCAPCVKEIPELNELAREQEDELQIFGVNFDSPDEEEMLADIRKLKIGFPVFATDPAPLLGVTRPEVLPTTFVFDQEGKLKTTLVGPQTKEGLMEILRRHTAGDGG